MSGIGTHNISGVGIDCIGNCNLFIYKTKFKSVSFNMFLLQCQIILFRDLDLEGGLEFLKYAINIEKASMIYLSPVQKEHVKRKWLDLEAVLSG